MRSQAGGWSPIPIQARGRSALNCPPIRRSRPASRRGMAPRSRTGRVGPGRRLCWSTGRPPTIGDGPVAALPGAVPNGSCTRPSRPGATGDAPEYRLERGYQDVRCGGYRGSGGMQPVSVYGHSHGGIVASGAAAMITNVRRLVSTRAGRSRTLYLRPPGPGCDANEQTVGRGDRDAWSRRCSSRWMKYPMRTWPRSDRPPQ